MPHPGQFELIFSWGPLRLLSTVKVAEMQIHTQALFTYLMVRKVCLHGKSLAWSLHFMKVVLGVQAPFLRKRNRQAWWFEWERLHIDSYIWTLAQLVELFGQNYKVWLCWRRNITRSRLPGFRNPCQASVADSQPPACASGYKLAATAPKAVSDSCLPFFPSRWSETRLRKPWASPHINSFFQKWPQSWCFLTAIEQWQKARDSFRVFV